MVTHLEVLKNHLPENSLPIVGKWFAQRQFKLKISKKRTTKFGDFRADSKSSIPQISVNGDLNKFAFLITLTHEFAHLLVWGMHKHAVKAHGEEWKKEYQLLMNVLFQKEIFPSDIAEALKKHMVNPPASSARDMNLIKALKQYDTPNNTLHLSDIPDGSTFSINHKKTFIKGKKQRTRYLCQEVKSKRQYLIHGIAEVMLLQ